MKTHMIYHMPHSVCASVDNVFAGGPAGRGKGMVI